MPRFYRHAKFFKKINPGKEKMVFVPFLKMVSDQEGIPMSKKDYTE
jgi:hypothetical protein